MSGSTSMSVELWRLSFKYASVEDLKSLILSCRHFCDIFQPILFHRLSFSCPSHTQLSTSHDHKPVVAKLTRVHDRFVAIAGSAHLFAMVSTFAFKCVDTAILFECMMHPGRANQNTLNSVIQLTSVIGKLFAENIGRFTNLQQLMLDGVRLEGKLGRTLMQLPKLKSLHLVSCAVVCYPKDGVKLALEEFSLEGVPYSEWHDDMSQGFHFLSPAKLEKLSVRPETVRPVVVVPLGRRRTSPASCEAGADVEYGRMGNFVPVFGVLSPARQSHPRHTSRPRRSPSFPDGIVATSVPLLEEFEGPAYLVPFIVPGRPVKKLEFTRPFQAKPALVDPNLPICAEAIRETLLQASESSGTIVDLTLPLESVLSSSRVMCLIAELFPKLKQLVFASRGTAGERFGDIPVGEEDEDSESDQDAGSDLWGSDSGGEGSDEEWITNSESLHPDAAGLGWEASGHESGPDTEGGLYPSVRSRPGMPADGALELESDDAVSDASDTVDEVSIGTYAHIELDSYEVRPSFS
ncbi:hypothetical protein FB45DRAFT_422645 [Roridomyces roridus]|uniref:F-box domain-containing protein n=1 Tax=Roridomyces roridus TaxID=1738132 RepID=A0AAD7C5C4_9AGAR|nr:hypothetical protein FB45DRAFT_422645 [Roridomyces roridus]